MSLAEKWCDAQVLCQRYEGECWERFDGEPIDGFFVDPYDMSIEIILQPGCDPDELSEEIIKWCHAQGFIYVHFKDYPSARSR